MGRLLKENYLCPSPCIVKWPGGCNKTNNEQESLLTYSLCPPLKFKLDDQGEIRLRRIICNIFANLGK